MYVIQVDEGDEVLVHYSRDGTTKKGVMKWTVDECGYRGEHAILQQRIQWLK
jgi:hypothetical protein